MLRIQDLVFDAYGRRFFDKATAALPVGAKVGLVGRNGAGKTTLFRLIQGELVAGSGDILMPRLARVGTADQEQAASPVSLIDTVLAADLERAALTEELETAPPERMGDIYERLAQIGADAAPAKAAEILVGLGFSQSDLTRPMAEFSGGWRMRTALAAALFSEPDLLLLDEPTNFLDLEGSLWLESRLKRHPSTALVISHDRELLDRAMDFILHLEGGQLNLYSGGFSAFERQRAERLALQSSMRVKIEARRAHLQSFVDRFGAGTKARQAQSRMKMIARLGAIPPVVEENADPFILPSPEKPLPPPLMRLEKAEVGYDGVAILKGLDLRLDPGDRIGLLGVNGAGKSTFARLLAGDLPLISGKMARDRRMKVGWFHQHQIEALDANDTPLQIIGRALPALTESQRRGRIAAFGFGADRVNTRVESLSGGERARLLLNLIALESPHLIILDEPTNHLDIDSRRALLDALNDYEGAVVLITHDRSLMEMVADTLWLTADGTVRPFDGDMEDYARFVLDRARQASRAPAARVVAPPPPPAAAGPLRRKMEAAEQTLSRESAALAEIDAALADPAIYVRNPAEAARLAERQAKLSERVDRAEALWLAAAEAYETATN
ncbi:MAG TPA: ABC-F family ATP-binding cassette domain-containing protein [Caulobacteraceae bacterium]|jgi:ATP-binding cassette subfamily F protein 3|nr:ABC-F family ATP-binding cassette domain-containing protein [Caulobacteraceae bacterium]